VEAVHERDAVAMQGIQGRGTQVRLIALALVIALGLVAVWALVPDIGLGVLLLLAASAEAVLSVVIYVLERRRHW
jgi:hypothetical protein